MSSSDPLQSSVAMQTTFSLILGQNPQYKRKIVVWLCETIPLRAGSEKTQWYKVFPRDGIRLHQISSYPVHGPVQSPVFTVTPQYSPNSYIVLILDQFNNYVTVMNDLLQVFTTLTGVLFMCEFM